MCLWCINHCHLPRKPETMTLNCLFAVAFVCVTSPLLTTGCSCFFFLTVSWSNQNKTMAPYQTGRQLAAWYAAAQKEEAFKLVNIGLFLWKMYINDSGQLKIRTGTYTFLKSWKVHFGRHILVIWVQSGSGYKKLSELFWFCCCTMCCYCKGCN